MNKMRGLAFAAMLALSLVASTSGALAKDANISLETAWTDLGPLDDPQGVTWETSPLEPVGVTWEE
jgi:hypothetical protein